MGNGERAWVHAHYHLEHSMQHSLCYLLCACCPVRYSLSPYLWMSQSYRCLHLQIQMVMVISSLCQCRAFNRWMHLKDAGKEIRRQKHVAVPRQLICLTQWARHLYAVSLVKQAMYSSAQARTSPESEDFFTILKAKQSETAGAKNEKIIPESTNYLQDASVPTGYCRYRAVWLSSVPGSVAHWDTRRHPEQHWRGPSHYWLWWSIWPDSELCLLKYCISHNAHSQTVVLWDEIE